MNTSKTKNSSHQIHYHHRFQVILDYIHSHLYEDMGIDQLSELAHFSRFHFQRQFSEFTGISVYKYIQFLRLKRASYQLVYEPERSITEIAFDTGFVNHESFSRAFKTAFEQTPSQFRHKPNWDQWFKKFPQKKDWKIHSMNVEIITVPNTKVAVFEHRDTPEKLNYSIEKFIAWRKSTGLSPVKTSKTFGVAYDDPETISPEDFRFDICGSISDEIPENEFGVINKTIPEGRCAMVRYLGSRDQIGDAVRYLYAEWLPQSDEELRDFPCYFEYLNLFPEVEEKDLVTDIYLPLK